jgi:hypothetical protein
VDLVDDEKDLTSSRRVSCSSVAEEDRVVAKTAGVAGVG